ncbi:hypothetical protein [Nonomuraea basaltis]|uniref:hypothetical protein n=1 Tax=Nonomuraea basaltis TaxID=2495887 RepID=UPI00110C5B25|nr:hypothetical protein [Nonomuraea basaltis]TMR96706.1 hypothetical protein EJK15_21980 [Nonomuraea basaltis]
MSEVVPLPSFGEVFFDARGQERCLRVTWHEGTLVLSLWRGEMCTASFRMPMEDVGRLLDTLDEGFAEATGEQPAVPAHDPGTEVIPGTGQYQRPQPAPQQHHQQQPQQPLDDRPTAALSPNDVLVARGPAPQDKLVASYGETTGPRDATPAYGERPAAFTGPQYVEPTAPQYTGDPFSGPQYTGDPLSGPQYAGDPLSGPQHYQQQPEPFTGPQYIVESDPVYQLPGDQRRPAPSTDPLGFPSQAADPYAAPQHRSDQYPSDPYQSDPYSSDAYTRRPDGYQHSQPQPQPQQQPQTQNQAAGLGTPMHGIPGAGRRRSAPQQAQQPVRDDYGAYQQRAPQPNPVDPLLALGRQEQQYQPQQPDPNMSAPYAGDPMFSTGERLRPEQPDYHERSDRREW